MASQGLLRVAGVAAHEDAALVQSIDTFLDAVEGAG